jgi:type VI protein secretion system component VasF
LTELAAGRPDGAASDEPTDERARADDEAVSPREAQTAGKSDEAEISEGASAEEEARDEPASNRLPTWLLVLIVIAVVLVTYSALRIAGEQRYQSCVQSVSAQLGPANDNISRLVRNQNVKRCSHSPL